MFSTLFFFNDTATTEIYTLSLHDALPISSEAALDGLYIVRTSVPATQMDAPECVRNYKSLANVERAFRSLKTIDLKVRRSEEHTSELQSPDHLVCRLLLEKKKKNTTENGP